MGFSAADAGRDAWTRGMLIADRMRLADVLSEMGRYRRGVLRCHPAGYLARVKAAVPMEGWAQLDADTFLSPGSLDAAMRAVGGICAAVDLFREGRLPMSGFIRQEQVALPDFLANRFGAAYQQSRQVESIG